MYIQIIHQQIKFIMHIFIMGVFKYIALLYNVLRKHIHCIHLYNGIYLYNGINFLKCFDISVSL